MYERIQGIQVFTNSLFFNDKIERLLLSTPILV
jgi:hypothetical protein